MLTPEEEATAQAIVEELQTWDDVKRRRVLYQLAREVVESNGINLDSAHAITSVGRTFGVDFMEAAAILRGAAEDVADERGHR